MPSNFRPTQNFVVLEPEAVSKVSAGGLVLPDKAIDTLADNWIAKVVSVGPGKVNERGHRIVPFVEAGMRVLVSKYGQRKITLDDKPLILVPDSEILGVFE